MENSGFEVKLKAGVLYEVRFEAYKASLDESKTCIFSYSHEKGLCPKQKKQRLFRRSGDIGAGNNGSGGKRAPRNFVHLIIEDSY